MPRLQWILGRLDPFVVTGYGESGSIPDRSCVLANDKGLFWSLQFGHIGMLPIFGPTKTERDIIEQLALLDQVGFCLYPYRIVRKNNDFLRAFAEKSHVQHTFIFVLDIPLEPVWGEGPWIGEKYSKAPSK